MVHSQIYTINNNCIYQNSVGTLQSSFTDNSNHRPYTKGDTNSYCSTKHLFQLTFVP